MDKLKFVFMAGDAPKYTMPLKVSNDPLELKKELARKLKSKKLKKAITHGCKVKVEWDETIDPAIMEKRSKRYDEMCEKIIIKNKEKLFLWNLLLTENVAAAAAIVDIAVGTASTYISRIKARILLCYPRAHLGNYKGIIELFKNEWCILPILYMISLY